jgi:very-short-patch-repair endonuclease
MISRAMLKRLTGIARRLRREMTPQERTLWNILRDRRLDGIKFRKQMPLGDRYVADFASVELKLIIELDGSHHGDIADLDDARTEVIETFGYRVVRFWNNDVTGNLDGVVMALHEEIRIARG